MRDCSRGSGDRSRGGRGRIWGSGHRVGCGGHGGGVLSRKLCSGGVERRGCCWG